MKTTVEIADELFRRAKAEAALRGRKFKELVEEGLRRVIESPELPGPGHSGARHPSAWDLMQDGCGIVRSGVSDLASNPKHLEGFGSDSMGDR